MFLKWIGFEYLVWAQNFRMLGPEIKTVAESRAEICGFIGTAALVWLGLEPEPGGHLGRRTGSPSSPARARISRAGLAWPDLQGPGLARRGLAYAYYMGWDLSGVGWCSGGHP